VIRAVLLAVFFLAFSGPGMTEGYKLLPDEEPVKINPPTLGKWIKYADMGSSAVYYDPSRVTRMPDAKMGVWTRHVSSAEQVIARRKQLHLSIDGFDDYSHSLVRYVFNCSMQQVAVTSNVLYSNDGSALDSKSYKAAEWDFSDVVPESITDTLMALVCKKKPTPS